MTARLASSLVKKYAIDQGFDACGVSPVSSLDHIEPHLLSWIHDGKNASMDYMARNTDKRLDPSLLVPNAKSVISLLMNYYPAESQNPDAPRFARYAYGEDYHHVLKDKMHTICQQMKETLGDFQYRVFTDSAPVLEREWARRSGLGVIGKSGMLIVPNRGSYFFISEIICTLEMEYDSPLPIQDICKGCRRCQMACPTGALDGSGTLDARRCLSYHSIESKESIPADIAPRLERRVYGCDRCLEVCPWNRQATPTSEEKFKAHPIILDYTDDDWLAMDEETFHREFKNSAIQRAGLDKIKDTLKCF